MSECVIPKTIHYCWFGRKKKSQLAERCIQSWKEKLQSYKIIEWNEDNFNIRINKYVEEAYCSGKYAFVSDYVRLFVLFNYGGIYMDTDVQVLKPFDKLLELNGFIGFEDEELVSTAVIGTKMNNSLIKEWLDEYNNRHFIENGKLNTITNVRIFTDILLKHGMEQNNAIQKIWNEKIVIYPVDYFSPLKIGNNKLMTTNNTLTIHWFEGTWLTINQRRKIVIIALIKNIIGFRNYNKLKKLVKSRNKNEFQM